MVSEPVLAMGHLLARNESSFHRIKATCKALLTVLQTLEASTPTVDAHSSTIVCDAPYSLATDFVGEEKKWEMPDPVYDEYLEEDDNSLFSVQFPSHQQQTPQASTVQYKIVPFSLEESKLLPSVVRSSFLNGRHQSTRSSTMGSNTSVGGNGTSEPTNNDEEEEELHPSLQDDGAEGRKVSKKKGKDKKKKEPSKQTNLSSIFIIDPCLYGDFPEGEIRQYKDDNLSSENVIYDFEDTINFVRDGSANPFVEVDYEEQQQRTQMKLKDLNPYGNKKHEFNRNNPRDLPVMDVLGSFDLCREVKLSNYKGVTKYWEKNQNPVWKQTFAFSKERLQSNLLEATLKDKDVYHQCFEKIKNEGVKPDLFIINAWIKGFVNAENLDEAGKWQLNTYVGVSLVGKTLPIMGFGKIGSASAHRAKGLGIHVIACDNYDLGDRAHAMGVKLVNFDKAIATSNFIFLHMPLTPATSKILSEETSAKMKKGVQEGEALKRKLVATAVNTPIVLAMVLTELKPFVEKRGRLTIQLIAEGREVKTGKVTYASTGRLVFMNLVNADFIVEQRGLSIAEKRIVLDGSPKNPLEFIQVQLANVESKIARAILDSGKIKGMKIPMEKKFWAQKIMIYECNLGGKPLVIASQMLESMIQSPRLTQTEAPDVAHAVLDGIERVMLGGESAVGVYLELALKIMAYVCIEVELFIDYCAIFKEMIRSPPLSMGPLENLASFAVRAANKTKAKLIVVISKMACTFAKVLHLRTLTGIAPIDGLKNIKSDVDLKDEENMGNITMNQYESFTKNDEDLRKKMALETLLAKLFASISPVKTVYASLHYAPSPYELNGNQAADQLLVPELKNLSELKQCDLKRHFDPSPEIVMLAVGEAGVSVSKISLYKHSANLAGNKKLVLPVPPVKVINGVSSLKKAMKMIEFMRRDMDGSDFDTRKRIACELLKVIITHYGAAVRSIASAQIQTLLSSIAVNPVANWKDKDCAIYLVVHLVTEKVVENSPFWEKLKKKGYEDKPACTWKSTDYKEAEKFPGANVFGSAVILGATSIGMRVQVD